MIRWGGDGEGDEQRVRPSTSEVAGVITRPTIEPKRHVSVLRVDTYPPASLTRIRLRAGVCRLCPDRRAMKLHEPVMEVLDA